MYNRIDCKNSIYDILKYDIIKRLCFEKGWNA